MANLSQLASDVANPDYVNPKNPDEALAVRFYVHPVENTFKSIQEGKPIFEDVVYVEINTPGDALNVIQTPARDIHKRRFRRQWEFFEKSTGGNQEINGIPLSKWPILNPAAIEMLKAQKFYTVEQVAFASDAQINNVGMHAGMAPFSFRTAAKAFLGHVKNNAIADERDKEIADLKAKDAARDKEMADMKAMLEKLTAPPPKNETITLAKKQ